jgi:hypothetical protein
MNRDHDLHQYAAGIDASCQMLWQQLVRTLSALRVRRQLRSGYFDLRRDSIGVRNMRSGRQATRFHGIAQGVAKVHGLTHAHAPDRVGKDRAVIDAIAVERATLLLPQIECSPTRVTRSEKARKPALTRAYSQPADLLWRAGNVIVVPRRGLEPPQCCHR